MASDWPLDQQQRNTRLMRRWRAQEAATWATATPAPPLCRANQNAHTPSPDTWPVAHSRPPSGATPTAPICHSSSLFQDFSVSSPQGHVTGSPAGNWTLSIIQSMNVWRWSRDLRIKFVSTLKRFSFETPGRSATHAAFDADRPANSEESLRLL